LKKSVLLICGSLNQTTMMHAFARELDECDCAFTPYYCDPPLARLQRWGALDRTILGGEFRRATLEYLESEGLYVDEAGRHGGYDLVVTCSDLIVPKNTRQAPLVLVQEGMTDPENFAYRLVRRFNLPLWLASTSTTGLSLAYQRFCVASHGYRELFRQRGVTDDRMVVTGIPNFDDCASLAKSDFGMRGYVLVATSDTRETFKWDDRTRFLRRVRRIADGRPVLFKLHPNENFDRSSDEIERMFPGAPVYRTGDVGPMIANCDVLVTQYSSVVFIGLALGKECHSYFDLEQLRVLLPEQNGGRSARHIADVCRDLIGSRACA
jgi:hypothetical protein